MPHAVATVQDPRTRRAAHLARPTPAIPRGSTNDRVDAEFRAHPELPCLVVVDNARPVGLIQRERFYGQLAQPFHRELYLRRSCDVFMDDAPVVVDAELGLEALSREVVASGARALASGFVVCDRGAYLATGTGLELMQALADLQAARNREVMSSIDAASQIQGAFLRASRAALEANLPEAHVHWAPREAVGGDCYYCRSTPGGLFLALIDCTGHGVPGAFMTLIVSSALARLAEGTDLSDPAAALAEVNRQVKAALGQQLQADGGSAAPAIDHGMDAAFLWLPRAGGSFTYAGARIPLYVEHPEAPAPRCLEPVRRGVGYTDTPDDFRWQNQRVEADADTWVFLASDGLTDQIGGARATAYGRRRMLAALERSRGQPAAARGQMLWSDFLAYQGEQKRRDDVSFFLARVGAPNDARSR